MPPRSNGARSSSIPAYELAASGRNAWQSQDKAIPRNFRLMLWLIDVRGQSYLENLIECCPSPALFGLLGELEDLGFIKRISPRARPSTSRAGEKIEAFSVEEQRRFEQDLQSASHSLLKGRVYVPEHRRKRRISAKAPSETVVLIVEDDPDQLALADLRVSMAGYQVWAADSASSLRQNPRQEASSRHPGSRCHAARRRWFRNSARA